MTLPQEHRYIWGYTLGALLAFAGLSIMLLDWGYMANLKESHGVPYFEQSEGFVRGAVTFVIGCLLLNKATFGWILLLLFLVQSGFSFLTALLFPIDYPEGWGPTAIDQIVDAGFTLGVFLFLGAQIWYLWQFKTRNV